MAQNVIINGVTYSNVPEVDIPISGGGTAVTCVKWRSNTTIGYRTAGGTSSTYGLLANTTYRYIAMYSE